jgi:phage-related tail protein
MTPAEINTAIVTGSFTNNQLQSIVDAVKFARSNLARTTKVSLRLGDTVKFTSSKTGMSYTGTVDKIAIKYVTVRTSGGLWRVPANMLSKVATA